jgi:hypothetical protein
MPDDLRTSSRGAGTDPDRPSLEELFDGDLDYPPTPAPRPGRRRRAIRTPPPAEHDLDVPYLHQLWDTPADFNGHWACGPACATMVLAAYGLLDPRPFELAEPQRHTSDFGWYVPNAFAHGSTTFDTMAETPSGFAAGIYGTVVDRIGSGWGAHYHNANGRGIGALMHAFLPGVANSVRCVSGPKRDGSIFLQQGEAAATMAATVEAGHPVIVSGRFGFGGRAYDHLIVVRGYYHDPATGARHWLVNDPYGFETTGTGFDGERVAYTFEEINPKWMCVFTGERTVSAVGERSADRPVRLFDPANNAQIGEGTLVAGTDKVYVKRLDGR